MSSRDPDLRPGSRLGLSASPPRRRRSIGMAITAAAAIVCAGGLWVAYQHFQSVPPDSADIPIIRADRSATKIKPPDNSNAAAPDEDEGVYSMGKPSGNAEHLLPPPEEPMAKPAPASPPSAQEIETAAAALPPSIATPPPAAPATGTARDQAIADCSGQGADSRATAGFAASLGAACPGQAGVATPGNDVFACAGRCGELSRADRRYQG